MPFFPVDDNFAFHAKARAAGNAAVGLWARAGSYCMKEATDGVIHRHELDGLGKPAEARRLVEVGLWHAAGHDCPRCPQPPAKGWVFHDWTHTGPLKSSEQIKARREAARTRQQNKRSRDRHGVTDPVTHGSGHASGHGEGHGDGHGGGARPPSPSPGPSSVQVVGQSNAVTTRVDRPIHLADEDLAALRAKLGPVTEPQARKVAGEILARATVPVANPLRYVLAAIEQEPDRYRPTNGPLRKADECPTHPGQPGWNCGGCAADRRAVD